jgi:putative endonuclease
MSDAEKRFVYILRSDVDPTRHYVGVTSDVPRRLKKHNHAPVGYTVHSRPWSLVVSMEFGTQSAALKFEKYLKSGSGRAFATRHFGDGD